MADGHINLSDLKATYSVEDIQLVDIRELSLMDEHRLSFEIGFAIALTLGGSLVSDFHWSIALCAFIFAAFGIYNLIRYIRDSNKIKGRFVKVKTPDSQK